MVFFIKLYKISSLEVIQISSLSRKVINFPIAFFINFGYFGWLEIFVQPNSDFPVGKITAGLPYPFMNDMPFEHRLIFMLMCFIFGVLFIWILTNMQKKYA